MAELQIVVHQKIFDEKRKYFRDMTPKEVKDSTNARTFTAQFNPENIVVAASKSTTEKKSKSKGTAQLEFIKNNPKTIQFPIFLDGTGASGKAKINVGEVVAKFMDLAYYSQSSSKQRSFLQISWGNFLFNCILDSVTVTYKLFDKNGLPIRASLDCRFSEYVDLKADAPQSDWQNNFAQDLSSNTFSFVEAKGYGKPNEAIEISKELGVDTLRGEGIAIARRQGQLL